MDGDHNQNLTLQATYLTVHQPADIQPGGCAGSCHTCTCTQACTVMLILVPTGT